MNFIDALDLRIAVKCIIFIGISFLANKGIQRMGNHIFRGFYGVNQFSDSKYVHLCHGGELSKHI